MSDSEAHERRGWIGPLVLLTAASVLYARVGLGEAIPRVIPGLLERSLVPESELARTFRALIFGLSVFLPPLILFSITAMTWGLARLGGIRPGFSGVFTLVARASLFATAGLLVKTSLVLLTKMPDPPVNLGFWIDAKTPVKAALLALTNPFLAASAAASTRSLRAHGLSMERAVLAGAMPWALGAMLFAQSSGSGGLVPDVAPVTEGWAVIEGRATIVRHPPSLERVAPPLGGALDTYAARLGDKLERAADGADSTGATPSATRELLQIDLFPDHAALERATGEALPVEVTGSIRGRNLLYLEMPGRSPAVPESRGIEDAARYVALMILAPGAGDAPRWFVEGLAHAEAVPYSQHIDRMYVASLKRRGVPSLDVLADPRLYRVADGPVLARALVDFIAYRHGGRAAIDGLLRDVMSGKPFRDAVYERTRLTMTALETEWQDSIRTILQRADSSNARGDSPDSAS